MLEELEKKLKDPKIAEQVKRKRRRVQGVRPLEAYKAGFEEGFAYGMDCLDLAVKAALSAWEDGEDAKIK